MGLSVAAWWKLLARHQFRVDGGNWPGALFDLSFAVGNSALGILQRIAYGRAIARTTLTADPVFVVGHWRTGTTLLHELLALDPAMRSPTTYECLAPHHFLLTGGWLPRLTRFTLPRTRSFDPMRVAWESPQEDEFALCNLGLPSPYAAIAFPNDAVRDDDAHELEALSVDEQRRWRSGFETFLRQLTLCRPGRLLLKSPTHTFRAPLLTRMFPRSRWILLVRNPFEVYSSTVKLWRSLYETYGYQRPDFAGLDERVLATFARMHLRWEATRSCLPENGLVVVRYEDLVRDPVEILRRVYGELSLGEFAPREAAVRQYFADRADYRPNRHAVDPARADEIRHRWRTYFDQYGYDLETGQA